MSNISQSKTPNKATQCALAAKNAANPDSLRVAPLAAGCGVNDLRETMNKFCLLLFVIVLGACTSANPNIGSTEQPDQKRKVIPRGYSSVAFLKGPVPPRFTSPSYPVRDQINGTEGTVKATYQVGLSGKPEEIKIVESTGKSFERQAINSLRTMQYPTEAHRKEGQVVFEFMIEYQEY